MNYYIWLYSFLIVCYPYLLFFINNKTSSHVDDEFLYIPVISHFYSFYIILLLLSRIIKNMMIYSYIKLYENEDDVKLKMHIKRIDPYNEDLWDDEFNWKRKLDHSLFYNFLKSIDKW